MPSKSPKGPPFPFPGNGNAFGKPLFVVDLTPFIEPSVTRSIDIGTESAPEVTSAGSAAFCFTDDFTESTNVRITDFSSDDVIKVTNNAGYRYVFGASMLDPHDLVIARTFGTEVSWIVLDDVITDEFIDGGGIVFDYSSALVATGFDPDFLTYDDVTPTPPGGCFEQSLDIDTSGTELIVNAAFAPFCFSDDATVVTDVAIYGFSDDDVIEVTNASAHDYNFTTGPTADDLRITYNDGTTYTDIVLTGILAGSSGFVFDYDTAVAAVGYTFMTFECVEQSIDVGTTSATVVRNASLDTYCFTDDANVVTNVEISGFGADDIIEVTNATAADYFFTTGPTADDLWITFNDGTNFTSIVLTGVLAGSSGLVFDYDSAVAAVGYEFMTFG